MCNHLFRAMTLAFSLLMTGCGAGNQPTSADIAAMQALEQQAAINSKQPAGLSALSGEYATGAWKDIRWLVQFDRMPFQIFWWDDQNWLLV